MRRGGAALVIVCLLAAAPAMAREWLAAREHSLEMKPGSPLDFSAMLPNPSIEGPGSALVAGPAGRLARADAPASPVRMLCASLGWSPASGGFPDHAGADRYVRQLRLHGYNIARLYFLDAALMEGKAVDLAFDEETLDRLHYLLAALKREGIYWIIDGMTSARGALGGFDDRWDAGGDLKLGVQVDEAAFEHWRRTQQALLARVNPYTGIAPIRDPALALIVPFNENGLEFYSVVSRSPDVPTYSERLRQPFNAWLKTRYASTVALGRAWEGVDPGDRVEDGTVALPRSREERGGRMRDFQIFLADLESRTALRMERALRDLGYRGLVSSYNNWPTLQANLSRAGNGATTMNTYHDWIGTYAPGGTMQGTSSLEDGVLYLRIAASTRWLDRPFFLTEYDHLFWNPYRYEAGLAAPAYGALQNWDVLCRHAHGPIVLAYGEDVPHKRQLLPYAIALDPVARAGETLSALLFRRGDVLGADAAVPFALDLDGERAQGLAGGIEDREPDSLTPLAVLTGIGLEDGVAGGEPAVPLNRSATSLDAMMRQLGEAKRLPAATLDAFAQGLYRSANGQIALDPKRRRLEVNTDRTDAIAFDGLDAKTMVGSLGVGPTSGRGLLSASALDDRPVAESRRILLIFATDARNTDMRFSDAAEHVVADYGRLPARIEKATVPLSLAGTGPWRLSPVGLDGTVYPQVASGEGAIETLLSNDAPSGPTTFFLVERL